MDEKQPSQDARVYTNSQRGGPRSRRGHGRHWGGPNRRERPNPSAPPLDIADNSCCGSADPPSVAPEEKYDTKGAASNKDEHSQKHRGKPHHYGRHHRNSYPNLPADPEKPSDGHAQETAESVASDDRNSETRNSEASRQRHGHKFHGFYNPHKQWHKERRPRDDSYRDLEENQVKQGVNGMCVPDGTRVEMQHNTWRDTYNPQQKFRSYSNWNSGYQGYGVQDYPSYNPPIYRPYPNRGYSSYQRRDWGKEGQFRQLDDGAEVFDEAAKPSDDPHRDDGNNRGSHKGTRDYHRNRESDGHHRSADYRGHQDYRRQKDNERWRNSDSRPRRDFRRSKNDLMNSGENDDDEETQKERLTEQLRKGEYECIVCCELVRSRDSTWSCRSCYHIFHLHCIRKWARSPTATAGEIGWRCPTCQTVTNKVPSHYFCFCGRTKDPESNRHDTPHSCGNVCGKERPQANCRHTCNLLCHPGPCPPCTASVQRSCPCGRVKMQVLCSRTASLACGEPCRKMLNCSTHACEESCHEGTCPPCTETVSRLCYCSKVNQSVPCTAESNFNPSFGCGQPCDRILGCGQHQCAELCHAGDCPPCASLPEIVSTCPCGRTSLRELCGENVRQKCTDPIPTCSSLCGKQLSCGPNDEHHSCATRCHHGECPPCTLRTTLKCCCSFSTQEVPCDQLATLGVLKCEKRCNKKRQCGRHKCINTCCVDYEHFCELVCNQKLSCGLHICQELCHKGNCRPCWNVSFDELACHCGTAVIYPPIPCGTRPPECQKTCNRVHTCDHPILHNCHSDETCPPCAALTSKWCFGGHELRKTIPCYQDAFSCGLLCNKPLPCGQHQCQLTCHLGSCQKECLQPCSKPREECIHPCGAPCHQGPCPDTVPCKATVTLTCICGTRSERSTCGDGSKSFQQMSASLLAAKMQDIQLGNSVDISDIIGSGRKNKTNRLECNEDCAVVDRNRRLALALQIRNPDLAGKPGPPNYSEFLKDEARKNPQFVGSICDKMSDLVQLAKQSKQKSRSHSFLPMNRDQRRIVHELASFYGCETESYDQEPKRNVVATAFRDKSYLPSVTVVAIIQREMGQRKAPNPVPNSTTKPEAPIKTIDYFDFTATNS